MAKDQVLDDADNSKIVNKTGVRKNGLFFLIVTIFCSFLFFSSCSLPKIGKYEDPLTPEEHLNLGVAYEKQGEIDNAIKEYEIASKKLNLAHLHLGNAYFQKNDLNRAEQYYRKAIQTGSKNADVYNNLAWLYYVERRNLDEAESLALKAIDLSSTKKDTYLDTLEKIRELKRSP